MQEFQSHPPSLPRHLKGFEFFIDFTLVTRSEALITVKKDRPTRNRVHERYYQGSGYKICTCITYI